MPLLVAGLLGASLAVAAAPACPDGVPLSATFLQPTTEIRTRGAEWDVLFGDIARLGMRDVFVQWTAAHGTYQDGSITWPDDPSVLARDLLDLASKHDLRVWLGLSYTDAWWPRIDRDRPLESVEVYLRRRRFVNADVAQRLAPVAREHGAFAGWYVPEEIDDKNWLEPARRDAIAGYVHELARQLREIVPGKPVAISGYATGFAPPAVLGTQWKAIVGDGGVDLVLLQDGIGAGHLDRNELDLVTPPIRAAVEEAGATLGMVVELFTQTEGGRLSDSPFAAEPAPLERVEAQIASADRLVRGPLVAFSVPDYMSPFGGPAATKLYDGYRAWARRCGVGR